MVLLRSLKGVVAITNSVSSHLTQHFVKYFPGDICRTAAPVPTKKFFSSSSNMALCAQQKIEVDSVQINYEKVGDGPQVLLCLPGALGFIESDFSPQLNSLKKKYTVVAWDPPGYGKSRPPDRDFCNGLFYHNDARLAHQLMINLGFSKFSLLGWSDGGITSLILSSLFPESVDKMVVWGANAYVTQADVDMYKSIRDIGTWSPKMKAPLISMYGEAYFQKMWEDFVDLFVEIHKNGGDLCKNNLRDIECPTLIIHGLKDPMVAVEHAEYLHKNIKGSEYHAMSEGKHNLHLRYADEFNALVDNFVSR